MTDPLLDSERIQREATTKRVNLRKTHPNLFVALLTVAVLHVALAVNFFSYQPTFNPYDIPKTVIGSIFLMLGVGQLVFLTLYHSLRLVRLMLALSISFTLFWGCGNSQQAFAGKSSFQLPLVYIGLAALQIPLLLEPATNPVSGRSGK